MENSFNEELRLEKARKKVKEIKGFYKHLTAYIIINIAFFIIEAVNLKEGESFFQWGTFITAASWGVGLFFHWYGVFKPGIIIGKGWEERKIKELMERENNNKKQWE